MDVPLQHGASNSGKGELGARPRAFCGPEWKEGGSKRFDFVLHDIFDRSVLPKPSSKTRLSENLDNVWPILRRVVSFPRGGQIGYARGSVRKMQCTCSCCAQRGTCAVPGLNQNLSILRRGFATEFRDTTRSFCASNDCRD